MLIPAKALTYGGPRSQIQVQLPNGKILPAIAATPINSPGVAVGFDQQGQAWVWDEVSKNDLTSTSIRKNRPSPNQELVYPFKVIAQWGNPGYIAQAGDRLSQQVEAQTILAFGNRGRRKNDFILLTEIETDQYRLKTKEGERTLSFSSPEILETFKSSGRFYGDDYYGLAVLNVLASLQGLTTTTNGNTTTESTPSGDYLRVRTISSDGITYRDGPFNTDITGADITEKESVEKTIRNKLFTGKLDFIVSKPYVQQFDYSDINVKNWRRTIANGQLTFYSATITQNIEETYFEERRIQVDLQGLVSFEYTFTEDFQGNVSLNATGDIGDTDIVGGTLYYYRIRTLSTMTISQSFRRIIANEPKIYLSGEKVVLYSLKDNTSIANVLKDNWSGEGYSIWQTPDLIGGEETKVYWDNRELESVVTDDGNQLERFFLAHEGENVALETENSFYFSDSSQYETIANSLPDLTLENSLTFTISQFQMATVSSYRVNYPKRYKITAGLFGGLFFTVLETITDPFNSNQVYPLTLIIKVNNDIFELSGQIKFNYQLWNVSSESPVPSSYDSSFITRDFGLSGPASQEWRANGAEITLISSKRIKYHAVQPGANTIYGYSPNNCLLMLTSLISSSARLRSATFYKRKNNQIMIAFSDNSNLIKKGERYADLYRLQGNKFIREGEKKGAYYPVLNPNSSSNPSTSFIGYYD